MLVPPLSNESRTRNGSPVPERLFELSNLLKRTLSPADHAFALRAALEAPDEYVEPFHNILLATAGRPGAAALRDALHAWVGMLGIEPAWMQEERPAYWMIGLPGDRNLELFADVFRRLGFLFGKMPGDKGPAGLKPVQGRHVLTVSAPISKADFLQRLMTSIAARHPALFVRAMDRTREGRGLVWERPRGDICDKGAAFRRIEIFSCQDVDPLPAVLEAFGLNH